MKAKSKSASQYNHKMQITLYQPKQKRERETKRETLDAATLTMPTLFAVL
jgi:hypothetical protein